MHDRFITRAIELSIENVQRGGGPFGCVIVCDDQIIAEGYNQVTEINDPTAHAEVQAIRNACQKLKNFDLQNCKLYTSCEPCPMCLSAIYWARIPHVYYANTKEQAAAIGFDDAFIYTQLSKEMTKRSISMTKLTIDQMNQAFENWDALAQKKAY